jgi:hypothetical protein
MIQPLSDAMGGMVDHPLHPTAASLDPPSSCTGEYVFPQLPNIGSRECTFVVDLTVNLPRPYDEPTALSSVTFFDNEKCNGSAAHSASIDRHQVTVFHVLHQLFCVCHVPCIESSIEKPVVRTVAKRTADARLLLVDETAFHTVVGAGADTERVKFDVAPYTRRC